MSEPTPSSLQFDKAETETPAAAACSMCNQPLPGSYFTLNSKAVCENCVKLVKAHFEGGGIPGPVRFLKASAFGLAGGLVGTVVWYLVEHLLSLQIGLVSILIGYLAGEGVARGSGRVGGLVYQLLAVVLTYACICFAWVPDLVKGMEQSKAEVKEAPAVPGADDAAAAPVAPAAPRRQLPGIVRWPLAMVVSVALPFSGVLGPLGLLIAAFGMWEAFRRNRKVNLAIAGPFALGPAP